MAECRESHRAQRRRAARGRGWHSLAPRSIRGHRLSRGMRPGCVHHVPLGGALRVGTLAAQLMTVLLWVWQEVETRSMRSMRSDARSRAGSERAEGVGASRKSNLHTTTNAQAPPALSLDSLAQMGTSEPRRSELHRSCSALTVDGSLTVTLTLHANAHRVTRATRLSCLSPHASTQRWLSENRPRWSREERQHQGRERARRAHASG